MFFTATFVDSPPGHSINSSSHHSLFLWGPEGELVVFFSAWICQAHSDVFKFIGKICEMCEHA